MSRKAEALASPRLAIFLLSVLAAALAISTSRSRGLAVVTLLLIVAFFLVLVMHHARARAAATHARAAQELNVRGAARVQRAWTSLPSPAESVPADHPYAVDLDVAGTPASLFRLLDVVSDATGRPTLARWLLSDGPATAELRDRQAAVSELSASTVFREELALLAVGGPSVPPERFDRFLSWAESADEAW